MEEFMNSLSAGDLRKTGSIPGSGRFPRGGYGNPLQYSYLDNPRDRGTWWASVYRVPKIQDLSHLCPVTFL